MNNKFFNKKYRQMNAHLKTKTSFRSKFSALLSLFIMLNIASAWGQTVEVIMTNSSETIEMDCSTNYKLVLSNQNGNRTYTFSNPNGAIKIEGFDFDAIYRDGQGLSEGDGYDYLKITYGEVILEYGNESYGWGSDCYSNNWYLGSYTYYSKTVEVPEIMIPQGETVTFSFVSGADYSSGGDCKRASFQAILTPICCPSNVTPADGGVLAADSPTSLLNWEDVEDATGYTVTITKQGGSSTSYSSTQSQLTLTPGLDEGTYTWKITPIVPNYTFNCAEEYTFEVLDIDNLDCIDQSGLVPQNGTVLGSRWVSWDPVPYADKYTIYLVPTSVGIGNVTNPSSAIYTTTTTSTEHLLPMIPQGDYYWTVIPENTALGIKATDCPINTFTIRYASADDHDISPSTQGKEFFFSLMQNGYYSNGDNNTQIHKYTAIIAPKEDATVTFKYYAATTGNDTRTFTVTAGQTDTVELPESWVYHPNPGADLNRTVYVKSSADISLYVANEALNSFDASIVLPTHALGTDYMIQTSVNESSYSTAYPCFMIIATKDDTRIKLEGGNIESLNPVYNATTGITLQEGQSYFIRSSAISITDLSGIRVSVWPREGHPEDSCKTIAVFNGNTVTKVPNNASTDRDHLVEQAYPISNWGTEFAVTSTKGYNVPESSTNGNDKDYIRVTAVKEGTNVYKDGTLLRTLNAGETEQIGLQRSTGSCFIKTSEPVACYLYQRSSDQVSGSDDDIGAPSMVWIAPIERGIEKITFSTFQATGINDADHYVNIVIPADSLDIRTSGRDPDKTVWLGDRDITREFQTDETLNYVQGSNYKYAYARIKINHGTYTVASNCGAKMVLHVYGLGNVRGYAYNAGSAAVPYKSSFTIGDGEREFDMSALPADYHFCSGQKYVFKISSNAGMDSVIFDFQNGERRKKVITPKNDTIQHTITQGGDYRITSYVFSTVYNHDLCQKETVVDTVEDHTYVFLSSSETVNDSVCFGVPYTYTRDIYTFDGTGELTPDTYTHEFNTSYTGDQELTIDDARSQYGCEIELKIKLKVFGEMTPGTIGTREIKCQEGAGGSLNLSVTELTDAVSASGGPSDAHYEWQKKTIVSINGTDTTWSDWTTITGQTEATYIVVEAGRYRRVYKSGFCNQEYFSNEIFVKQAGSFDPGDHIDETIEVCNYQTVTRTIGGSIASSSILGNATDGYYVVVPNNGNNETIYLSFQWQKAEGTLPATDAGWSDITTDGNGYNYNINSTFTTNTYFRRLIDATGSSCELNLSMGVFGIVVKPDYNVSIKKLSGCHDQNNAKAVFDIKYADSTTGNFNISYAGPVGTTSGTAVANGNKYETGTMYQGVYYTYTVVDATYGCEKTGTINIANPTALGVATISDSDVEKACQGSEIQLPIPAITGGDKPYSVTITSTGLGITEARPIQVEVNTNDATTTAYNVPMDVTPEAKTLGYVIKDVNNCRVASDQTVVTIEKVPAFNLSNTELSSCEAANVNATITATVTNATGSPKYDYEIDYGTGFNANDKLSTTHTFGAATPGDGLPQDVYNITVTDENTTKKCSASKEHEIKSNFVPTVVLVVPELTMVATNQYSGCPNKDITVSVSAINSTAIGNIADNTYQYSIDGINYVNYGDEDEYPFQATTSNKCGSQTISVYVKEVSTGCVFKQDLSIIIEDGIDPTIDASLTNIDVTTYFCPTYTVPKADSIKNNIKADIHDNCASDDDLSVSVTPNTGTFNVTDGAQPVTITVEDLCGNTATKSITITPKPWPNFKIDGTDNNCYCHGDNIELEAVLENDTPIGNTYDGAKSYRWYKDGSSEPIRDNDRYSGAETNKLKISSAVDGDAGEYTLVIIDKNDCPKEATITICVHPAIEFNLE